MVVGEYFPFIHFVSIVLIPFAYWVACIELGVYNSNENEFTLTFGQVCILPEQVRSNRSSRANARFSRFSLPSHRLSKYASLRPVYSTGSMTLRGSDEWTATVRNHNAFPWMKAVSRSSKNPVAFRGIHSAEARPTRYSNPSHTIQDYLRVRTGADTLNCEDEAAWRWAFARGSIMSIESCTLSRSQRVGDQKPPHLHYGCVPLGAKNTPDIISGGSETKIMKMYDRT